MEKSIYCGIKALAFLCLLLSTSAALFAQLPEIKVDLNMINRPAAEVQEPGYTPWVVTKQLSDTLTVNGITFIIKKGPRGSSLAPTYYKTGIQTGVFNVRFTDDGLTVKDGDFALGSSIYLIIKGLPAGTHSLVTYHNIIDALAPAAVCPMDVYVDSVLTIDNLVPTVRMEKLTDCQTAELQITAQDNQDVVIAFKADTTGTQAVKNVILNGFQLNGVNAGKKSSSPIPTHREEHLAVPIGGSYLLRWQGSPVALSHDVYFGTDSTAVANADHSSPSYKGNKALSDTSYNATNLYSMNTYYWRIDEVGPTATYKGNVWIFRTRQLAFPDAEGAGKFARGGRGGKVVEVTNLNDDGPGSLREAVTNNIGPRTIVFNVSGIIELQSRLVLSDPYVYVAGQTAPGKGICIRKAPFGVTGNDAIVRFMRVRLGAGITYDGMGLTGCNNSIMDHSSISWTIDEAFSSRGAKNITLQRTLISEALNVAGHQNYPAGTAHGYAATIGGDTGSFHHNLLAHCYGRNWSLGGGLNGSGYYTGTMDIVNNVVYNWGSRATDGGAREVNFLNNYYKPGAGTTFFYALNMQHEGVGLGTQRAYFNGNVMPGRFDETNQTVGRRASYSNGDTSTYETFVNAPFFPSDVTTQTAGDAYKNVLSDVGAAIPVLDDHDIRMVNETLTGTYSVTGSVSGKPGFPDNEADAGGYENYPALTRAANWDSDHDGMPDWWETAKGFNPNSPANDFSESNADPDMNGNTNLDDYLQWMANAHYFAPAVNTPMSVDLKLLARGYTSSPSFAIANVVNGTVNVNASGVATVMPTGTGMGSFQFTVTDAAGSKMTRIVNFANAPNGVSAPLPVKLSSFTANRKSANEVTVKWETAQEVNNDHFEVLRSFSATGTDAFAVAKVKSKAQNGNSNLPLQYEIADANNFGGTTYYRLQQIDKDGSATSSEIRMVNGDNKSAVLKVWPVPNNGRFFVSMSNNDANANLQVYDAAGKQVLTKRINNNSTEQLSISTSGLYYLKVVSIKNGEVLLSEKITVQR